VKNKVKKVLKEDKEEDSLFNEIKIKSQAAMEYLMTYGWAILIIALTLGVLYSLGIMNPKNFTPKVPPGSCFVFRPNGPGTTDFVSLQGTCGYLPMYVGSFDGSSGYINVTSVPPSLLIKDLTIVFWFYPTNIQKGRQNPIDKAYWAEFAITLEPNGAMSYYHGNWSSYYHGDNIWPSGTFINNAWQFASVTRNISGSTVRVYKNGKIVNSGSFSIYPVTSTNPIKIGSGYAGYFQGSIANVQIYNTVLTPQEIQYLYQQGLGGAPVRLQNLVAWWPLNGDAKDYSGNNNHGTINGGVTFVQNYNPP